MVAELGRLEVRVDSLVRVRLIVTSRFSVDSRLIVRLMLRLCQLWFRALLLLLLQSLFVLLDSHSLVL